MNRLFYGALSVCAVLGLFHLSAAQGDAVTSLVNTGSFNADEMTIDPSGHVFVTGFAAGSSTLSIMTASGGSLSTVYSSLPGTTGGNLNYTNGFASTGTSLWWNNANSGPGFLTELSKAPESGGGPIVRNSPADDLDSLSYSNGTLYTAYYAGYLYTLDANGNLTYIGFNRSTSLLSIAANGSTLYVVDNTGAYQRNPDGSFTNIINMPNTFRTNGSRLATGDGNLYALDRNNLGGYWDISLSTDIATFITDPQFTNLTSLSYYNGNLYLADTGDAAGSGVNNDGHIWMVSDPSNPTAAPLPNSLFGGMALIGCLGVSGYFRRKRRIA